MIKKPKSRKTFASILAVLILLLSGTAAVYSWIIGDVAPTVTGDFSVGSVAGLVLELGNDSGVVGDINNYFGLTANKLILNECSSVDAATIYGRQTDVYFLDNSNNEIVCLKTATDTVATKKNSDDTVTTGDYAEISFTLRLATETTDVYYVYFIDGYLEGIPYSTGFQAGSSSQITTDGLKALRLGLYVDNLVDGNNNYLVNNYNSILFDTVNNKPKYAIFCNDETSTPSAVSTLGTVQLPLSGSNKASYNVCQKIGSTTYGTTGTPSLNRFSDYALSNGSNNIVLSGTSAPSNYLFKLTQARSIVKITIRIWLEGMSEYCVDSEINQDDEVSLKLYFAGYCESSSQ